MNRQGTTRLREPGSGRGAYEGRRDPSPETRRLGTKVSPRDVRRLERVAVKLDLSPRAVLRVALRRYLAEELGET